MTTTFDIAKPPATLTRAELVALNNDSDYYVDEAVVGAVDEEFTLSLVTTTGVAVLYNATLEDGGELTVVFPREHLGAETKITVNIMVDRDDHGFGSF